MQFYQHSGRCGVWGVPMASGVGLLAGLVLALVYVYVISWIPILYVSFLATAGFGAAIGAAVAYGARWGRMRNTLIATMVAGLTALVAMYFAWAFDPIARFNETRPLWKPELIWEYMTFGFENGFWSIGRNGNPVTGFFLVAVWIAEAGIVIGVACTTLVAMIGSQPYCEETDQWTNSEKNLAALSLVNDDQAEAKLGRLMQGDLQSLREFYRSEGDEPAKLELDLATCPDCPTCNYLTVRMIRQTVNKKNEVTKEESKILVNLQIDPEEVSLVREAGIERPAESFVAEDANDAAASV